MNSGRSSPSRGYDDGACYELRSNFVISKGSCDGWEACKWVGDRTFTTSGYIGPNSCVGTSSCWGFAASSNTPTVTMGSNSCVGNSMCRRMTSYSAFFGSVQIGDSACQAADGADCDQCFVTSGGVTAEIMQMPDHATSCANITLVNQVFA